MSNRFSIHISHDRSTIAFRDNQRGTTGPIVFEWSPDSENDDFNEVAALLGNAAKHMNSHDALLKAAKEALGVLVEIHKTDMGSIKEAKALGWDIAVEQALLEKTAGAINNLRAAIALAEGQPKEREGGSQ